MKRYANWNACYSCDFDVADGHTSMSCPAHLRKATHDIYFNRQNAQQYIDLGFGSSVLHQEQTQDTVSQHLTVRGGECRYI
jgi:hypothetical protein